MKAADLKEILANKEEILLLDMRDPLDYTGGDGKIEGSQNISGDEILNKATNGDLPKNKKIIVICKRGIKSEPIATLLREKGFDIENLEGGIIEWTGRSPVTPA